MLPQACKHKCKEDAGDQNLTRLRCDEIDDNTRVFTHDEFWRGEYNDRLAWIAGMVDMILRHSPQRHSPQRQSPQVNHPRRQSPQTTITPDDNYPRRQLPQTTITPYDINPIRH